MVGLWGSLLLTTFSQMFPYGVELDFAPCPPQGTLPNGYSLRIQATTASGKSLDFTIDATAHSTSESMRDSVAFQFKSQGWDYRKDAGVKLLVIGDGTSPIKSLTMTCTAPTKPAVRLYPL